MQQHTLTGYVRSLSPEILLASSVILNMVINDSNQRHPPEKPKLPDMGLPALYRGHTFHKNRLFPSLYWLLFSCSTTTTANTTIKRCDMAAVNEVDKKNKSSSSPTNQNELKIKAGDDMKNSTSTTPQGGCSNFVFACFGLSGSNDDETPNPRGNGSPRDTRAKRVFPTLSGASIDSSSSWDENILTSDEELLEDLELVLEGRGLVSTIFLPSKSPSDTSSVPRTAFIRSKHGDVKIECQVVVDNEHVSVL